jgi:DNA-binding CsgD family transcriptional regulator
MLESILDWSRPPSALSQRLCLCIRAEAALAQHEPQRALRIVDALAQSLSLDGAGQVIPYLGKLRGAALAALGQWAAAEATFGAALAEAQARDLPPLVWRLHAALGTAYLAQQRRSEADEAFAAARAVAERLAAGLGERPVRVTFLDQLGRLLPEARPPSARAAARAAWGGLTPREREVAAHLARGRSNREIAAALVVSERTVEYHVGNILGKLGLTSRAQAAVWAAEHGLTLD